MREPSQEDQKALGEPCDGKGSGMNQTAQVTESRQMGHALAVVTGELRRSELSCSMGDSLLQGGSACWI